VNRKKDPALLNAFEYQSRNDASQRPPAFASAAPLSASRTDCGGGASADADAAGATLMSTSALVLGERAAASREAEFDPKKNQRVS
jgi:hypothetical protein